LNTKPCSPKFQTDRVRCQPICVYYVYDVVV
jgi:hypothetical protein